MSKDTDIVLTSAKEQKAPDLIYAQIKNLILKGELTHGDRLPSERRLMEMARRSRHTVREALRMLENEGFIKTIPGSGGAIIQKPTSVSVEQPLENMLSLNSITHKELLEYRTLNEAAIAGWAARRRTEEDLLAIKECIDTAMDASISAEEFVRADTLFHELLAQAGHNRIALIMNKVIRNLVQETLYSTLIKKKKKSLQILRTEAFGMHYDLYRSIQKKNPVAAQELMYKHIERFENLFLIPNSRNSGR